MRVSVLLALAALPAASVVALLRRRARRAGLRGAVDAALAPARTTGPRAARTPLAEAGALHVSTRCDGLELAPAAVDGTLRVTEDVLTFDAAQGWRLPHERLSEAVFVARHASWKSGPEGVVLRLFWRLDDRTVTTTVFVRGRRLDAERLRKELHLRAGGTRVVPPL
jgi:hypothetical protein